MLDIVGHVPEEKQLRDNDRSAIECGNGEVIWCSILVKAKLGTSLTSTGSICSRSKV